MRKFSRALITGASRGLGRDICFQLAQCCEHLTLVGRSLEGLVETQNILKKHHFNGDIELLIVDLNDIAAVKKIADYNKKVDLLVNNAGLGYMKRFENTSAEEIHHMMMVNMYNLTQITNVVSKRMIQQGGGQIINIASAAAFFPIPYFGVYAATKSYVLSFSQALAYELKPHHIQVKTVCPGGINTDFSQRAGLKADILKKYEKFILSPQQVARAVFQATQKDQSVIIPGLSNHFLNFLSHILPRSWQVKLSALTYSQYL